MIQQILSKCLAGTPGEKFPTPLGKYWPTPGEKLPSPWGNIGTLVYDLIYE